MKLATYQDGSRDGQLVVVSRDLRQACYATGIASRLLSVLDDWGFHAPLLATLYEDLNAGRVRHAFDFESSRCMAPLPRTYQCLRGAAYPSHGQLLHEAWPQTWPAEPALPRLTHWPADDFAAPEGELHVPSEVLEADFGGELFAITGDVRQGAAADQAVHGVRLLGLANALVLRRVLAEPGGLQQAVLALACAPVVLTPDELGEAWAEGRAQLTLQCVWNGRKLGLCDTAADMRHDFGLLLAQAARRRRLRAGTVVLSGTVSNAAVTDEQGRRSWPKGFCALIERQAMEQLQEGLAQTAYLRHGDTVRLEAKGRDGQTVFGAIEHTIMPMMDISG